jgi:hypothetical protein
MKLLIRYFTDKIFNEDRMVLKMEQEAFDSQGADWNQEIFPVILKVIDLLRRKCLPLEV